jgi:hypothetical protein
MPTEDHLKRTKQNVLDSDATVIFLHGDLKGGSKGTIDFAVQIGRPWLHIDLKKTLGLPAWWKEEEIGFTGSCKDDEGTL